MKKRILRPLPGMDLPFLILVLTLVGFGLVMLASASSAVALYRRGDAWAYLRPQLLYAALGLCGMWLASRVDYHIVHKLAWPRLGLSLIAAGHYATEFPVTAAVAEKLRAALPGVEVLVSTANKDPYTYL